jgi:hypothetical protein
MNLPLTKKECIAVFYRGVDDAVFVVIAQNLLGGCWFSSQLKLYFSVVMCVWGSIDLALR